MKMSILSTFGTATVCALECARVYAALSFDVSAHVQIFAFDGVLLCMC